MKTTDFLLLILGMTLVTYIPRAIPAVLLEKLSFGGRMEKFLRLIPYTAMAALIFPGVFAVDANPIIGVVGGAVAALLAWKKQPVMTCVLAAIAVDFIVYLIIL